MTEFTDTDGRHYVLTNELRFVKRKDFLPLPGGREGDCVMREVRILQQKRCYLYGTVEEHLQGAHLQWHDVPTAED